MSDESFEIFEKLATEKFPGKLAIDVLHFDQESLDQINKNFESNLTQADLDKYGKHFWLKENKCPKCGSDLLGFDGTFNWGIIHGTGYCRQCDEDESPTEFRYYHYVGDCKKPLTLFALIGF